VSKHLPTRKWWATTVTAAATIAVAALTGDGINSDPEVVLVVGTVAQRLVAWITRNESR
jgi:hypothetical protein